MDLEFLKWIFLIGGVLLVLLELIIPSGFAITLGISGIIIGVLKFFGLLANPLNAVLAWLLLSSALVLLLRPLSKKFFKGESSFKIADEDFEAMDKIVEAVEPINEFDNTGRIKFQGISWQARSFEGDIPAGSKVKIKYRENTTWIVEAVDSPHSPSAERLKN